MREIKFRGMAMGGHVVIISDTWRACVNPDTIAQLIGHDSHGREVYEGDKLTGSAGYIWTAKFIPPAHH